MPSGFRCTQSLFQVGNWVAAETLNFFQIASLVLFPFFASPDSNARRQQQWTAHVGTAATFELHVHRLTTAKSAAVVPTFTPHITFRAGVSFLAINKKNVLPQLAKLLSLHRFEQLYPEQAEKVLLPKQCSPALALSEEQKRIRPKQSMDQISSRNDVCLQVNAWRS
eukprot:TRINITY_DN518_c0_g1_i14.p1 TRINITY_DN518_c0_g1~~TRINITY_DN518_c0_g1_i14.p1  ORF type:complete len:167 (+),score=38.49 TRINITY_DN518_c0_g1_i14:491-991(+)